MVGVLDEGADQAEGHFCVKFSQVSDCLLIEVGVLVFVALHGFLHECVVVQAVAVPFESHRTDQQNHDKLARQLLVFLYVVLAQR